jgi:hypothetical protein
MIKMTRVMRRFANCGYTILRWADLKNAMDLTKSTGNALFDEFWFYWGKRRFV